MTTEISGIKLSYAPSKFTGEEIKEITATVYLSKVKDNCEMSATDISIHYNKNELQDKTLNEVFDLVLNQVKQTLQTDITDFPAL